MENLAEISGPGILWLFDGIDYSILDFRCGTNAEFYRKELKIAGIILPRERE
ncbi:MAG: hypothetical protein LUQ01_01205 [Methanolinea sp.]|nr:hypothetical protein [Methanolinea sp.]